MISKFDAVLIGAFILIVFACGANFWLIANGFNEFGAGFWTFMTAAVTGEIVSYSLYRSGKQSGIKGAVKTIFSGNKLIEAELKDTEEEATNAIKTDNGNATAAKDKQTAQP